MTAVSIVNYGIGNILSVQRALEHVGAKVSFAETPEQVAAADHLVLPGVGAFSRCAEAIHQAGLWDSVAGHVAADKPYFGICVGMQLMLDSSTEFGGARGFGFIPGQVERLPEPATATHKIPFIGWKRLSVCADGVLTEPLNGAHVYFVHSFAARPDNEADVLAHYKFADTSVVAAIGRGAMIGTQFHPEKSGEAGLALLDRFIHM